VALLLSFELEFIGEDGRVANFPSRSNSGVSLRALNNTTTSLQTGDSAHLKFVTPATFVPKSVRLTRISGFYNTGSGSLGQNEGDQAILDEIDRGVAAAAASEDYWRTALSQVPADDAALRSFIKARIDESVNPGETDRDRNRAQMLDLLQDCAPNALRQGVRKKQDELERSARYKTVPNVSKVGPITSATVTLEPPTTTDEVVAYVTNQRDVPADVWEVELYSLPQSRAPFATYTSRGGHDSRLTPTSLKRPIGPHETRELPMMSASWDEGMVPAPRAVATVAVLDDGRAEGSAERRQQLLAERARDAVDIECWLGPLRLVRNVSAANALDALRERVRTRKCQSSTAFHADHFAAGVLTVASQIQAAPEQKDAILAAAIAQLEDERQAILKLVNR
jgi:hypothetical protein